MKINITAIGTRLPDWINMGFYDYAKRMPVHLPIILTEIAATKHSKHYHSEQIKADEGKRILSNLNKDDWVVALEIGGTPWSTPELAHQLQQWQQRGANISLIIGGAEGLSQDCRNRANQLWSLSALTFPHGLARIIVAEQIYRAWSILQHHPYHRE